MWEGVTRNLREEATVSYGRGVRVVGCGERDRKYERKPLRSEGNSGARVIGMGYYS